LSAVQALLIVVIYAFVLNYVFLDDDAESHLVMLFLILLYPSLVSG
jgi:ABC-type iron transport system FetAB permease component